MKQLVVIATSIFLCLESSAQSPEIDTLEKQLKGIDLTGGNRIRALVNLSWYYAMTQESDKAIEKLNEAFHLNIGSDSLSYKPMLYQEYSRNFLIKGDFTQGLTFALQLEKYANAERDRMILESETSKPQASNLINTGDAYLIIGEIYRKIGDYQKALEYALQAIRIGELLDKQWLLANAYNNIAIVYNKLDDLERSKNYYFKALSVNKKIGNRDYYVGSNLNNIGIIYRHMKLYDSAMMCYEKALNYNNSEYGKATMFNNIGAIFYDLKSYDSAEFYHQTALRIQQENDYKDQANLSKRNLADVANRMKNYSKSIRLALEAYNYGEQEKSYDLLSEISKTLSEAYNSKGNFEKSLFYFKKHKQYHDSVFNEKKRKDIINMQLKFDTLEKEKENALLRKQAELNRFLIKTQYIIGAILLIVFLLAIYVLYLTIKRNKIRQELSDEKKQIEKNQLEKEISYKNQELVNFALQIVEKNEFLSEVTKEVNKWSKNGLSENERVKELSKKLKAHEIINKHRKEFDAHVNSVYESFYARLQDKYPDLTQNERRLAALLRLKLSSKEISSVLGISAKSVDMNRYRLRKKLSITNEENLIAILSQI